MIKQVTDKCSDSDYTDCLGITLSILYISGYIIIYHWVY